MIQIEKIEIVEFRGIRNLTVDLKKKSFGISGPNGTGKSGIVDAIEFALTGNITRLSGAGTAGLSIKLHAPHVDFSNKPEKSLVRVTAFAPSISKSFTIERNVKSPGTATLTPSDPKTKGILAQLEMHPEFALSRREIIKYVLTPPGDRSKDIQNLLRLEHLETVRMSLQRVANDARREQEQAEDGEKRALDELHMHLGKSNPKKDDLIIAVNERRAILKLNVISALMAPDAFKEGMKTEDSDGEGKGKISKAGALNDIAAFDKCTTAMNSATSLNNRDAATAVLGKITDDPDLLKLIKQKILVEQGLGLLEDDACPLCDIDWDRKELEEHFKEKLEKSAAATGLLRELAESVNPLIAQFASMASAAERIVQLCGVIEPKLDATKLSSMVEMLVAHRSNMEKVRTDATAIPDAAIAFGFIGSANPDQAVSLSQALKARIEELPDLSKEDAAREFLIIAQDKYDRCRARKARRVEAEVNAKIAASVSERYGAVSVKILEDIYNTVQDDFTSFYSFINRDDEDKFQSKLTPSVGKLAFNVDFYGRGKFPPGAYHSEGHQDGMGLCLYLALMKHTLGNQFTLAVLDDVLMSVDAGHRREVCAMLKKHFPTTQFILTTHDPVWLMFMKTENLIQGSLNFGGWTVDTGPQIWSEGDVWKKIESHLAMDDVPTAAATLRRYLEYVSTILAGNFRARLEYHGNGQYDFGDLWPGVLAAWKELLQGAMDAAKSWGKNTAEFEVLRADAKAKIAATKSEDWMINKAAHYNDWATFQNAEFGIIVTAFRELLKSMQCANVVCQEFLCVSPFKGQKDVLRCGCGERLLSLKRK
jgi:hypothetical protein